MKEKEEQFIKYAEPYQKYGPKIDLKVKHTVRVKELCREIAESLNLTEEEVELASLCGLLHDIGRFEQWKNYQTFDDLKSIDHGDLGEKILKENKRILSYTKKNQDTVLRAVKYHNKYKVPKTLSKKNQLFVNITRDADKIDILKLFCDRVIPISTKDSCISEDIYQAILNKQLILGKNTKTKADGVAIRLGFIFDLHFQKSYEIIQKEDYMNRLLNIALEDTQNEKLKKQIETIRPFINQYIEEMITC
ncbi:MAG: HD domain-containing protein [Bacilli bacterium]|nr:HD domain-containing protein [Bacilli bacterium]